MPLKRLSLVFVLSAVVSLGLVSGAPAGVGIADEPCPTMAGENTNTCPVGTVGQPYAIQFREAEGSGCGPGKQTFTIDSGTFPPGLALATSGHVSGTPTSAGSFRFYVKIAEPQGEPGCAGSYGEKEFTIPIVPGLAKLTLGPDGTTPATVGTPYSLQMTASVAEPKTWSISSGALPAGLGIDASTGLISGTPSAAGQFNFTVLAKMNGDSRSDTKVLGIVVRDQLAILGTEPFTAARRATGEVSVPFDSLLTATGGTGTYTWSLSSGALPPGLDIADGVISGTPTIAGLYRFTATVTDTEGRVANYLAHILIAERLAISTAPLRPARQAFYYQARLRTVGGILPRTWRIVRGPLPRGIRFDRSAGLLFGIPTRPGRYRVIFEATDALGVTAKKTLAILVIATPKPKKSTTG